MGKLASKQVALAKQILETEDEVVLDSVDQLLNGGIHYQFSEAEIRAAVEEAALNLGCRGFRLFARALRRHWWQGIALRHQAMLPRSPQQTRS